MGLTASVPSVLMCSPASSAYGGPKNTTEEMLPSDLTDRKASAVLPTCAYLNLKFALCVLRAGSLNLSTNTRQVFAHSFLSVFQT